MENLFKISNTTSESILHQVGWLSLVEELSVTAHFNHTKTIIKYPPVIQSMDKIKEYQETNKIFQQAIVDDKAVYYLQLIQRIPSSLTPEEICSSIKKKDIFSLQEINYFVLFYEASLHTPAILKVDKIDGEILTDDVHRKINSFIKEFRLFVDVSGTPDFFQHPVIGSLMRELAEHEKKVSEIIINENRILQEEGKLQQSNFDIIDNRYVVAIRTDRYNYSLGNIVHRSESGATLYVELKKLNEHSEKRSKIKEKINYEIFLIEKQYSELIKDHQKIYIERIKNTFDNDLGLTKAKWINRFDGNYPILTQNNELELNGFYHPCIKSPVKNNIKIKDKKIMLISGPNTGGKSVIIKSIAINYLLAYSGYPVAASSSQLCHFESLYFLASDGQSIEEGLSSFSSEAKNILEVIENVKNNSLLLIDEIFSSTSSEEASILAYSVMNVWKKMNKGIAIFTSHHHTLKTFVHNNDLMESAHVGFDINKSTPTYKLYQGVPGSSFAIAIFLSMIKIGNCKQLLEDEISKNQKNVIDYESILKKHAEREVDNQNRIDSQVKENEKIKNNLKIQLMDFELKKHEQFLKFKNDLEKIKHKGKALIEEILEGKTKISKHTLDNEWWAITKELASHDKTQKMEEHYIALKEKPKEFVVGKCYYSNQWKKNVEIISLSKDKNTAEVMMGKIKTRVKCEDLFLSDKQNIKSIQTNIKREFSPTTHLDARGMRLDEFQRQVDIALSFLISGDIPSLEIIHGHGDGVLKNWLQLFLKENKNTFKFETPDLSYGGSTRIYLI